MKKTLQFIFLLCYLSTVYAQKDSLQLGDRYSDDQIYAAISYAQFYNQPETISRSNFSYAISAGFMKDIILNKQGSFSVALGVGYGFDFFNHSLQVDVQNNTTIFSSVDMTSNKFKSQNIEIPFEIRWRSSNAIKYDFWRIYAGVKLLYNLSNTFQYEENNTQFKFKNLPEFNKFQYGLTLSAGYDAVNIQVFYNLTTIFKNATIDGESIDTSILEFGFIFYIL